MPFMSRFSLLGPHKILIKFVAAKSGQLIKELIIRVPAIMATKLLDSYM